MDHRNERVNGREIGDTPGTWVTRYCGPPRIRTQRTKIVTALQILIERDRPGAAPVVELLKEAGASGNRERARRSANAQDSGFCRCKFASVYPLYVQKAERKNRTKEEVDQVICWLTGYSQAGLQQQIEQESDFETFFAQAPVIHPNGSLIKGVVCGVRVEDIEDPLMQKYDTWTS